MKKILLFIYFLHLGIFPSYYTYDPRVETHWLITYYSSGFFTSTNVQSIGPIIQAQMVLDVLRKGDLLDRIASVQCVKRSHSGIFSVTNFEGFLYNPLFGKITLCKIAKKLITENNVPFGFLSILRNYPWILSIFTCYKAEDIKLYNQILAILEEDIMEALFSSRETIDAYSIDVARKMHASNFSTKKIALETLDQILESWPKKIPPLLDEK